jgi:heme exporter protein A
MAWFHKKEFIGPMMTQPSSPDSAAASLTLTLDSVSAGYGARTVFRAISLRLRAGEILVVSGSNGSGKSTLLRLLCGLQRPSGGTIRYGWQAEDGKQGQQSSAYAPAEVPHLLGWVAPDLALYRELTARENLRFFAAVRGIPPDDARSDALLAQVGLGGRGDDVVASYSSGMVQRLRYAYALLHRPPVLLLDEPTVTLDERGAGVVEQIVYAQRQQGLTVIATNDPRELRFGDYVLELQPL